MRHLLMLPKCLVRVFLSVTIVKGWELHHKDVNNAFLHGVVFEEDYLWLRPVFTATSPTRFANFISLYMVYAKHQTSGLPSYH